MVYTRIALITSVCLLVFLELFLTIWVTGGSASSIINQSGLQRARVQAITKDVLILAYRPGHIQAISELQNTLPAWEETQNGLMNGDPALQLTSHIPDDVKQLVLTTQPDFTSIDTAAHYILDHAATPIDAIQVDIIVSHEHSYTLAMTQVVNAWQQHIDSAFLNLFWIKTVLVAIIFACLMFVLFFKPSNLSVQPVV